jgi:hypothetical protein
MSRLREGVRPLDFRSCDWCAGRQALRSVTVEDQRGERRDMTLCRGCDRNPDRTVWLRWRRAAAQPNGGRV